MPYSAINGDADGSGGRPTTMNSSTRSTRCVTNMAITVSFHSDHLVATGLISGNILGPYLAEAKKSEL